MNRTQQLRCNSVTMTTEFIVHLKYPTSSDNTKLRFHFLGPVTQPVMKRMYIVLASSNLDQLAGKCILCNQLAESCWPGKYILYRVLEVRQPGTRCKAFIPGQYSTDYHM